MYIKLTEEEKRIVKIFEPYIVGFPPELREDAPPEAVEAYKKFMEIIKGQFDDYY